LAQHTTWFLLDVAVLVQDTVPLNFPAKTAPPLHAEELQKVPEL